MRNEELGMRNEFFSFYLFLADGRLVRPLVIKLIFFFRQNDIRTYFSFIMVLFLLCKNFDYKDIFNKCNFKSVIYLLR